MPKNNLPAYAIVELLIRLQQHEPKIGDYKTHAVAKDGVMVKTTTGVIRFAEALVKKQFEAPEKITADELVIVATSFKPAGKSKPI